MKIFITGATGFIGGATARELAKEHTVLAMVRRKASALVVNALGAQAVECDLQTVGPEHVAGCDAVIHCAAYVEEWGPDVAFQEVNVEGTRRLLEAARLAGVPRFIFISTEAQHFHGQDMLGIDESQPYAEHSPYPYARTKGEAERLVLAANSAHMVTLALRPRLVWGPGDRSVLPALVSMIEQGRFRWIGRGQHRTSTTHIANLVRAIQLALVRGQPGHAYFIADAEVSALRDFLTQYVRTRGVEPPKKSVPKWAARAAARVVERGWRLFGIERRPPLVRFTVDMMSASCTVNAAKAARELGYRPVVSVEQGLAQLPRYERRMKPGARLKVRYVLATIALLALVWTFASEFSGEKLPLAPPVGSQSRAPQYMGEEEAVRLLKQRVEEKLPFFEPLPVAGRGILFLREGEGARADVGFFDAKGAFQTIYSYDSRARRVVSLSADRNHLFLGLIAPDGYSEGRHQEWTWPPGSPCQNQEMTHVAIDDQGRVQEYQLPFGCLTFARNYFRDGRMLMLDRGHFGVFSPSPLAYGRKPLEVFVYSMVTQRIRRLGNVTSCKINRAAASYDTEVAEVTADPTWRVWGSSFEERTFPNVREAVPSQWHQVTWEHLWPFSSGHRWSDDCGETPF